MEVADACEVTFASYRCNYAKQCVIHNLVEYMSVSLFVFAVADKKTLVLDVERHMEEAQELVSVNSDSSSNSSNMHIHTVSLNS